MTAGDPGPSAGRFGDLSRRVVSAAALLLLGAIEIWLGGPSFLLLVTLVSALMIWELGRMTLPPGPWAGLVAVVAALSLLIDEGLPEVCGLLAGRDGAPASCAPVVPAWWVMPPVALIFLMKARLHPVVSALMALAILTSGHGLFVLRDEEGRAAVVWLLGVVIVSDVAGYFVGRTLGGPKFWPAISPKKTWSGTIAGWIGAALLGLAFKLAGQGGWALVILSPFVAFAGQMGDIAESWIKRRAGVKDSSNLIPGHGGVMDRFDALTGAMVVTMILAWAFDIPVGGG